MPFSNDGGKVDKLGRLSAKEIRFLNFDTSIFMSSSPTYSMPLFGRRAG